MFNAIEFLEDYNIQTAMEGPNTQPGWINICCPFCHDHSYHGGFRLEKGYYNCWRCKWHSNEDVVMELLNVSFPEAREIVRDYQTATPRDYLNRDKEVVKNTRLELPSGTQELNSGCIKYLTANDFNPEYLQEKYRIKSTGHLGAYKFRLVIPIYFNNKLVSYQCRDVTGKAELRWKACSKEDEVTHFKHILYNWDNRKKDVCVVVEGISDVWRLGDGAVATCGTGYTTKQVELLAGFKKVFIFFDNAADAQKNAGELALMLSSVGCDVEIIESDYDDPGVMPQAEANKLMKEVLKL